MSFSGHRTHEARTTASPTHLTPMLNLTPLALPLLLANGAPTPAASDLMAAIPEEAVVALHVPNPRAIIAARETNDLVAFMLDPEWESIAALLMEEEGTEETEMLGELKAFRDRAIEAMSDSSGLAVYVTTVPETGVEGAMGFVAQGGPKVAAMLEEMFVGESAATEQLAAGVVARVTAPAGGRKALAFATNGDLIVGVESSAGIDAARALVRQSLTGGSQRPGGPFGVPDLAKERGDCAMEVAVNLQPILDAARAEGFNSPMEERMFDMMFSQMTWAYGSMSLGTGETSDLEFVVPYGAESALAGLFANFNAADLSSFRSIPAEAHTAQVINVDLAGIFDWAMDLVKAEDEMAYEQVMAGIGSVTEMSGIDLIEDVLGNLSGQMLGFSTVRQPAGSGAPTMMDMMMASSLGGDDLTLVMEVEDTEVLLEAIEFAVDMSGAGEMLEVSSMDAGGERGGLETWSLLPEVGSFKMALGAGRLIISTNPSMLDAYAAGLGAPLDESFASDERVKAILPSLSGAGVTIQKTADMLDSIAAAVGAMGEMFGSTVDLSGFEDGAVIEEAYDDFFDRMNLAADRVVQMGRRYFEGTMSTDMVMEEGQMRFRQRTR